MAPRKKLRVVDPFPLFDDSKLRALIEKSFDVVAVINAKGKILYASPSIVRMYGRTYDEILGLSGLKYVHPADLPRILKLLGHLILHPKTPVTSELRIKHKNGQWRWVVAIGTNLLKDKNINGIVVNFHDITERKMLEDRKDEFISIASHELKTPITSLKVYVQMLKRKYGSKDPQLGTYLEKVDAQMTRLTNLINELLNVSKILEGKIEVRKERADIGALVSEVVEDMQQIAQNHKIILKTNIRKTISIDKYRITQVLINLLSNAIRYSPGSTDIIVSCRQKNNDIIISVKDFGIGVAKTNLKKIFERFYQEKESSRKNAGLGLGLYICAEFVKQHGGKIWVRSQDGKGSTFSFSLPIKLQTQKN